MQDPNSPPSREGLKGKLADELEVMRDALTRLSLAMQDYVFECRQINDPCSAKQADEVIAELKSMGTRPK